MQTRTYIRILYVWNFNAVFLLLLYNAKNFLRDSQFTLRVFLCFWNIVGRKFGSYNMAFIYHRCEKKAMSMKYTYINSKAHLHWRSLNFPSNLQHDLDAGVKQFMIDQLMLLGFEIEYCLFLSSSKQTAVNFVLSWNGNTLNFMLVIINQPKFVKRNLTGIDTYKASSV